MEIILTDGNDFRLNIFQDFDPAFVQLYIFDRTEDESLTIEFKTEDGYTIDNLLPLSEKARDYALTYVRNTPQLNNFNKTLFTDIICTCYEQKRMATEKVGNNASSQCELTRKHDESIKSEMIAKVDRDAFHSMLNAAGHCYVSEQRVTKILSQWARAKYDLYLLFGGALSISKQITIQKDPTVVRESMEKLMKKFPKYAGMVSSFSTDEFLNNKMESCKYWMYGICESMYSPNRKLTTFFAQVAKDKLFDIELSKMFQNSTTETTIFISIDPCDYLTMSLNKHNWSSCHSIDGGCYSTGALAYVLDTATAMAYKSNGTKYTYTLQGEGFDWNSKGWRQCVYISRDNGAAIFSNHYPYHCDELEDGIRQLYESTVSNYLSVENVWTKRNDSGEGFVEVETATIYNDLECNNCSYVCLKEFPNGTFYIGTDVPCLSCGDYVHEGRDKILCYTCAKQCDEDEECENDD